MSPDKPNMFVVPPEALLAVGEVMSLGAGKHPLQAYRDPGYDWTELYNSTMRHLLRWADLNQSDYDEESDVSHLAHAAANVLMLLASQISTLGTDDRCPSYPRPMPPAPAPVQLSPNNPYDDLPF